jgi:hypothetical protein
MTDQPHDTLERLESYEILPSPPGDLDASVLILRTKSAEFRGIADRQSLLKLAVAIQRHAGGGS